MSTMRARDQKLDSEELLEALRSMSSGDFSRRLPENLEGQDLEIARAFNQAVSKADEILSALNGLLNVTEKDECEVKRLSISASGGWSRIIDLVNLLIENLSRPAIDLQQINDELQEKARLLIVQNSEVERKNREIEDARNALEEKARQLALTSKYKSEFLANMSHELRTPLNSLMILSKLLAENSEHNLSERQVEFAKTIHTSGSDLLTLINEILDLSKIESGTIILDLSDVSFKELSRSLERAFEQVAVNKDVEFDITIDDALPASFYTDAKRLYQVLRNLISNAIKFTEAGFVRMRIRQATEGWSQEHPILSKADKVIAFEVTDSGIGIHQDKQDLIFEAFHQADGTTGRKYGGTGLGLSISRELASLLGGVIELASEPGEGSTFTLFLPSVFIAPSKLTFGAGPLREIELRGESSREIERSKVDSEDGSGISLAGCRILLVDDDVRNIFALTSALEDYKMNVVFAETGKDALDILERDKLISAVLMDIMLPEMDGYEVIRRIRAQPQFEHLPVIAVTAKALAGDREKCLAAGADEYIAKPVNVSELVSLLRCALARRPSS